MQKPGAAFHCTMEPNEFINTNWKITYDMKNGDINDELIILMGMCEYERYFFSKIPLCYFDKRIQYDGWDLCEF